VRRIPFGVSDRTIDTVLTVKMFAETNLT